MTWPMRPKLKVCSLITRFNHFNNFYLANTSFFEQRCLLLFRFINFAFVFAYSCFCWDVHFMPELHEYRLSYDMIWYYCDRNLTLLFRIYLLPAVCKHICKVCTPNSMVWKLSACIERPIVTQYLSVSDYLDC